ncbi:MAG: TlpA family protein disulfide reductase [Ignavibacteria bacterium]|nr:TlpA family protein disulfide reductase [Ignavibacteria bacterium]
MNSKVVVFLFYFLLFSFSSCRSEVKENSEPREDYIEISEMRESRETQDSNSDNTPKSKPLVFFPKSIVPAKPGNLVDFAWVQDGKEVKFSEFAKGKIVLLNFWGTWCPPCRREIPDLIEVHNESEGKDFVVVGITLERDVENAETIVKDFVNQKGIRYINIIDKDQSIARAYGGINAVPTTFIIDKKGKIVETLVGARGKQDFIDAINRARK